MGGGDTHLRIYGYVGSQTVLTCPLVKVGSREGKAFGGGEGRVMRKGTGREVDEGIVAFSRNFECF